MCWRGAGGPAALHHAAGPLHPAKHTQAPGTNPSWTHRPARPALHQQRRPFHLPNRPPPATNALYISTGHTIHRIDARTGHSVLLADTINSICGIAVDHACNILFAGGTQVQVLAGNAGRFYGQAMRPGREYTIAGSRTATATTRAWATTARPAGPPTAGSPALPWTPRATS